MSKSNVRILFLNLSLGKLRTTLVGMSFHNLGVLKNIFILSSHAQTNIIFLAWLVSSFYFPCLGF